MDIPRTVVFLAGFDSQLKWCARLRDEFVRRGFTARVVVPQARSALSEQQIRDAGFDRVEVLDGPGLLAAVRSSDVAVSALAGPANRSLSFALAELEPDGPGPVLVTGWVGVIIEKIIAGYLDRCGSDLVAVNSVPDLAQFRHAAGQLGLPADNLLLAGLPMLHRATPPRGGPIRRVLFADQPTVPTSASERTFVYHALIEYAETHPDREVVLKPRHRPDEGTYHRMRHHPEQLLAGVDRPPNFAIDYTPIVEALPATDLLLTMSSTACLEALDHGCRVGLVLDLGVHERYGNHVFIDSGLLRTFAQLGRDEIGEPDPEWLAGYFFDPATSAAARVVDRTVDLLTSGVRPSRAVWTTDYFLGAAAYQREISGRPAARRAHPFGWRALSRRVDRHGPLEGTLRHAAAALMPPLISRPVRTLAQRTVRR